MMRVTLSLLLLGVVLGSVSAIRPGRHIRLDLEGQKGGKPANRKSSIPSNSDEVTTLEGYGTPPTQQFSGYITVNETHGRNLHYWLVTSQNTPDTDPLLIWFNGGPGCSSLDGYLYEHGPLHFAGSDTSNLTLVENPYSWNKIVNMLYVEAPAGVGFSYSNDPSDYNTDDWKTANDNYLMILGFIKKYPSFANRDLYIAGESYAGVYVPTLVDTVLKGNEAGVNAHVNLKGFLVGNGVTDAKVDGNANVPFLYGHGLYPTSLHTQIVDKCKGDYWNPNAECSQLLGEMENTVGNINIYDIYLPCDGSSMKMAPGDELRGEWRHFMSNGVHPLSGGVPCISSAMAHAYLNNPTVRQQIHVESAEKIGEWTICSGKINYQSTVTSLLPYYPTLLQNYRALIYSGDVDACVPYTGTETWTSGLNLPVKEGWRPWLVESQVAGYVTAYENMTFATVKGSGHMVPQWKPQQALEMFKRWLFGNPL